MFKHTKTNLLLLVARKVAISFRFVLVLALLSVSILYTRAGTPERAYAAVPATLNFQARLLQSSGAIVPDGYYNIEFKLYDAASAGTNVWTETRYDSNGATAGNDTRVQVKGGYLSVYLGDQTAFGAIDWTQQYWLTMNIGGTTQTATPTWDGEMNPRLRLTSVPYAQAAGRADTLDGIDSTGFAQLAPSAAQGVSSANSALRLNQTGVGNLLQLQGDGSDVLTLSKSGVLTVSGAATFNGGLTVATGQQLTNSGSTLLTAVAIADKSTGGAIGTAAATVDAASTFNINQTTSGQTLTLPAPTSTTAGRIVFVTNIGTADFAMHGVTITSSKAQSYIWNGSSWVGTNIDGAGNGATSIGTLDGTTKSANGAVVTANQLFMQTADATYPGLVSTGSQTFAGAKTFNGQIIAGAGIDLGTQTLQGTTAIIDFTNFDVDASGNGIFAGDLAVNGGDITSGTSLNVTASNGPLTLTSIGVGNDIVLNSADTIELQDSTNVTGSLSVSGTSTFTGLGTFSGGLTVATGQNFINSGSTLFTGVAIGNIALGGNIGTAAATVDAATTFNVSQTTAGQTLTLPAPTNTASGRIAFVNNVGSVSFTMYDSVIAVGQSNTFIWNGSTWVTTVSLSGSVVSAMGTINSQAKSADGAVISGSALFMQTADATYPGLVSTGSQTFAGAKTFNGQIIAGAGIDLGTQTLQGTTAIIDFTNFDVDASGNGIFAGDLAVNGGDITSGTSLNVTASNGPLTLTSIGVGNDIVLNSADTIELQDSTNVTGSLSVSGNAAINGGSITSSAATLIINAAGTIDLQDNVTADSLTLDTGGLTFSGVTNDITTGLNEDLTVVASGTGVIDLNDVVRIGTLGATGTDAVICRNAAGQLAACNSTFATTTQFNTAFVQGGNSFTATAVLGTNDAFDLQFETAGVTRLTIDQGGNAALTGNLTVSGTGTSSFAGNLGIGTTAPGASLHVVSSAAGTVGQITRGASLTATVSNKSLTSNVATLTTSAAHGFNAGKRVTVSGVDATFDGTYAIASTPTTTTFTYAKTAADVLSTPATGTATADSQTADLQQLQNGLGENLVVITAAGNLDVAGNIEGTVINGTAGFTVNGAAATGNYLRGNGTNFVSSALLASDLSGTIFSTAADSGTGTLVTSDTVSIQGGTNGIDTSLSGDTFTLNLDTTEIGTTTFGAGSGFTWTFDASALGTDTSFTFGDNALTLTAGIVTLSGDLRLNGNDIQDSVGTSRLTLGATNAFTGSLTVSSNLDVAGTLTAGTGDAFQVNASGAITAVTGITTTGGYSQSGAGANTFSGATSFTNTVNTAFTSATAFRVQNTGSTDTMFTVDTDVRGISGGNRIKIGDSTGLDTAVTILQVDSTTADITSNLSVLNGGLYYNSTTNTLKTILNGAVDEICTYSAGNCVGSGGSISGVGTAGRLPVYSGTGSTITDSWLQQSGSDVLLDNTRNLVLSGGNLSVTGNGDFSGTLAVGTADAFTVAANGDTVTAGSLAVNGGAITSSAGTLTVNAGGAIDLQDAVTADSLTLDTGALTFSNGVATDITTALNENLTVVAAGTGFIDLNDIVRIGTLGATDTDAVLCRNAAGQLAACSSTFATTTQFNTAFIQNGNSFGATAVLGSNDAFGLNLETNGITRMSIASNGLVGLGTTTPTALLHARGNLSSTLTGNVAVTNLSTTVTGTGTSFTTELVVGDSIKIGTEIFTVSAIGSATSLTLDSAYQGVTASGLTAYRDPTLFAIDNGDGINKLTVTRSGNATLAGNLAVNGGNITSTGALSITPGGALTVGVATQTATLQGTITTITSNGAGNDIILNSADAIELQGATNVTGNFTVSGNTDIAGTLFVGTGDAFQVDASGNILTSGDLAVNGGDITSTGALNITPGGALTVGAIGQTALMQGSAVSITSNGVGSDITLTSADQIILNSVGTIELQDNTNITGNFTVSGNADVAGYLYIGSADQFQVDASGNTQTSGTLSVGGLSTLNGGLSVTRTLGANSGTTQNVGSIGFTTPADTIGSNTSNGLNITPVIGDATGGTNTANVINIADTTGDAQVNLNAVNIGTLTGTVANEYALNIGSGWDSILRVGGTEVINGSGQIVSSQITGDLFSTSADSGTGAVARGDTLAIQGGTNGIDTSLSGDTYTVNLDYTEISTATFGGGSGFTWTYDVGAVDPTIAFASDQITLTVGSTILSGDLAVNGGDITSTGALNITPGGALTVGVATQTTTIQGTATAITSNGIGNDVTVTSADQIILNSVGTIELQDNTNVTGNLSVTGNGDFSGTLAVGTADAFTVAANGDTVTAGSLAVNGGAITSSAGTLTVNAGGAIDLQDAVTADSLTLDTGALTFSNGVATDITTALNENLTVEAAGTGFINLNDIVRIGTLGATDTDAVLCRNAAGQLAACSSTFATTTQFNTAFIQNGNSFGATAVLGSNDAFNLQLETAGVTRLTIDQSGNSTLTGNQTVQGTGTSTFAGNVDVAGTLAVGTANAFQVAADGSVLATAANTTGTGYTFDTTNAAVNGTSVDVQSSSSSQFAFQITSGNGTINGISVRADGSVGVGTTGPAARLHIQGTADDEVLIVQGHSTQNANILEVKNSTGTVLAAVSGTGILKVGTTAAPTLGTARLLVTEAEITTRLRIGDATNGISFNDEVGGQFRLRGTARNTKKINLIPEYPGATMTGDGTNNTGTMTSDFCSGSTLRSINTTICGTTDEHNFYSWTAQATNDYDVYVRYQIPSDFDGFASNTTIQMFGWRSTSAENVELALFNAAGNQCGSGAAGTSVATTNLTWTQVSMAGVTGDADCTAITPGSTVLFRIRLTVGSNNNFARAGAITFEYLSKF